MFVAESHFTCSKSVSIISRCCNTPILWCAAHFSRSSTLGPLCRLLFIYPSTMQDDYQLTMGTLIRQSVRSYPDTEIVHRNSRANGAAPPTKNFDRIERAAAGLAKLRVRVGDRVGVMDWNSLRHYELYWAVPAIGAVFTS